MMAVASDLNLLGLSTLRIKRAICGGNTFQTLPAIRDFARNAEIVGFTLQNERVPTWRQGFIRIFAKHFVHIGLPLEGGGLIRVRDISDHPTIIGLCDDGLSGWIKLHGLRDLCDQPNFRAVEGVGGRVAPKHDKFDMPVGKHCL